MLNPIYHKFKIFFLIIVTFFLIVKNGSNLYAQEIIESTYLEKDQGLLSRVVNHVTRDQSGYFYFFFNEGIQKYDGVNFYSVSIESLLNKNISPRDIRNTIITEDNTILLELDNKENTFYIFAGKNKVLYKATEKESPTFNNTTKEKQITIGNKTYLFTHEFVYQILNDTRIFLDSIPNKINPKFLTADKKGNIIAAYSDDEFYVRNYYILDTLGKLHNYSKLVSIYETAKDVYADDAFYKWVIAGYNGVKIVSLKRDGVQFINQRENVNKGEFGNVIMGICTRENDVYFNTEALTYYQLDSTKTKATPLQFDIGLLSTGINQLKLNPYNKQFYSRGYNNSNITDLYTVNFKNEKISSILLEGDFYDFSFLTDQEILLVGQDRPTSTAAISIYNIQSKKVTEFKTTLPPIKSVYYDEVKNQYWIGSINGVFLTDEEFVILEEFSSTSNPETKIAFDAVGMIVPFNNSIILCSKGGGVYIVDISTNTIIKNLNVESGLTDNMVAGAIEDNQGNLWISTFNGLNVIDKNFNLVKTIFQNEGLPNREFNTQAIAKDKEGNLYFGTLNGLCVIDPNKVMEWEENDKLAINNVSFYKNGKKIIEKDGILHSSLDSIVITYSINDYFKYPHSKNIIRLESNQEIKTHEYEDKISISDIDYGNLNLFLSPSLNSRGEKLNFVIKRDYKALIKNIIWALLIVALILFSAKKYSDYRLKKESDKLKLNEKISELKLTALQGQMNPHFIFNALGSIQYFIQSNQTEEADKYLTNFSKLVRGILDSSKNRFISLENEINLLKLYVGLEKMRFPDKFDSNFRLSPELDKNIEIPPMLLQPFIENSINHGIYHLDERKGKLDIEFVYVNENEFNVFIKDNGIGREASNNLKKEKNHISRGLSITKERLDTLNNIDNLQIHLEINDYIKNKKVEGTIVELKFTLAITS